MELAENFVSVENIPSVREVGFAAQCACTRPLIPALRVVLAVSIRSGYEPKILVEHLRVYIELRVG